MLNLSENYTALVNLKVTLDALEHLRALIDLYSEDKPGPAYVRFVLPQTNSAKAVQFDRPVIITALRAQEKQLVDYLGTLNIDATK